MSLVEITNTHSKNTTQLGEREYWGVYWLNVKALSMGSISATVGISKSTVQTIIKRIKNTGSPIPKPRPGRPKKVNERDLRRIEAITRKDPFASYNKIISELKVHQIDICRATLISYLKELGFGSYFSAHKPKLTEAHRKKRLRWAKERVNWTPEDWKRVVWSDESRFEVEGYQGGARVLRKVGERYEERHVVSTTKWGNGSVMVWGCFWAGGFGPLVFINGTVKQEDYVNILAQKFHPWFVNLCETEDEDFILQEDGATCHTGNYTTFWKDGHQIQRFDMWPAQSPDLNPIEHLWSCLERVIHQMTPIIKNVDELKTALNVAWEGIHVDLAKRLVDSMKDRCQAVIDAKGGPTKY